MGPNTPTGQPWMKKNQNTCNLFYEEYCEKCLHQNLYKIILEKIKYKFYQKYKKKTQNEIEDCFKKHGFLYKW